MLKFQKFKLICSSTPLALSAHVQNCQMEEKCAAAPQNGQQRRMQKKKPKEKREFSRVGELNFRLEVNRVELFHFLTIQIHCFILALLKSSSSLWSLFMVGLVVTRRTLIYGSAWWWLTSIRSWMRLDFLLPAVWCRRGSQQRRYKSQQTWRDFLSEWGEEALSASCSDFSWCVASYARCAASSHQLHTQRIKWKVSIQPCRHIVRAREELQNEVVKIYFVWLSHTRAGV